MKIGSSVDTQAQVTADTQLRSAGRAPATAAVAGTSTDQVDVSSAGAQISALAGSGDFDSAKVDAIRQSIREGRFTINAGAIANRLISDATELLGPRASRQ